jgi:hypothetical protein
MIGKILTREEILKLAEDQRSKGREVEVTEIAADMAGEGFFQTKLVVKAMGVYPEVTKYSKSYRKEG